MHFIIFDLEFNQDFSSLQNFVSHGAPYPFEIIQIGAVKLDADFNTVGTFNRYVKPTFYTRINPFITDLTGITTEQLQKEQEFPDIYTAYTEFIGGTESISCTWGLADIKGLFKNVEYHQLNPTLTPKRYINLQPHVSMQFNNSSKSLLRLQHAVERLNIPTTHSFHDAFNDAFYTAEVFKKVYNPGIKPKVYDPSSTTSRPKPRRKVIDTNKLIEQFEKMYARKMSEDDIGMILLAYKMGRTNQFLK